MATTNTSVRSTVIGNRRAKVYDITIGTYATSGVSVTPSDVGMTSFDIVLVSQAGGYVSGFDHTNNKILIYRQKDPGATGGADIALPEVANGVGLSSLVVRCVFIGN